MKHLILHINLILLVVFSVVGCTTESRRMQMRAELDSINALNRADKPFSVQDVEPYVQFFESHGSPNDRLLAHYLLGRAYYLRGEAPMALQCYHNAVDCADTTAQDCDYAQLSRVYGQMAEIFGNQGLYRHQLTYDKLSVKYAWLGKDTLAALMGYELESYAYRDLGMQDSAITIIEDVASKFIQFNKPSDAAISLGTLIDVFIKRKEYQPAKQYIDIYESKSGYFDAYGNIAHGREIFYYLKGLYYLGINNIDSAEYYFRKELSEGRDFNNQHGGAKGLSKLFQILNQPDSVAKYALYAYAMNDSMHSQRATKDIRRIQAMYDYTHNQELALKEREKSANRLVVIWICISIIAVFCSCVYIFIKKAVHKRREIEQKYLQSLTLIEQARHDLEKLQVSEETNKVLISEKEQIIHEQESILKALLLKHNDNQSLEDKTLFLSDIYRRFKQLSIKGQEPVQEDWTLLEDKIFHCYPGYSEFMQENKYLLNDRERKICHLVRIGFKPTTIGNMLNIKSSYVSELRAKMSQKLFYISENPKAFDKRIKEIY